MHYLDKGSQMLILLLIASLSVNLIVGVIIIKYARKNAYLQEMNNVLVDNARIRKTISQDAKTIEEYHDQLNVIDFIGSNRLQSNE